MFTGLIEEVGRIAAIDAAGDRARVVVEARTVVDDLPLGASIAVDGVCVTATEITPSSFAVDLMKETMRVTALGRLRPDVRVNLERAMRVGDRLGGHLVQGHVDGVGEVVDVEEVPGTTTVRLRVPSDLLRYLVAKGSLCIAGVSLTIAALESEVVTVGLIPHTIAGTNLGDLVVGSTVNLEVDVVAKYVERMLPGARTEDDR
jgi:riboflavin synthase